MRILFLILGILLVTFAIASPESHELLAAAGGAFIADFLAWATVRWGLRNGYLRR